MSNPTPPTFQVTFTSPDGTSNQPARNAAAIAGSFEGENLPQYDSKIPLEDQLRNYRVQHPEGNDKHFWPAAILKSLVTPTSIKRALMDQCGFSRERASHYSERIFHDREGSLVQIFTIFLLIDELNDQTWTHVMECRSQDRLRDYSLPLILVQHGNAKHMVRRDGISASCCFTRWKFHALESVVNYQHRLAIPMFRLSEPNNTIVHQSFDNHTILPWCECEERGVSVVNAMSGGYGSVMRVKIHPLCHRFHDVLKSVSIPLSTWCWVMSGGPRYTHPSQAFTNATFVTARSMSLEAFFAIKRLKTTKRNSIVDFKKEVDALERFNGKVHKHMVTLLATYEQNDYYHMIFPWADRDLESYWEAHPKPDLSDNGLIRWLSKQCLGIMEAVNVIHNPTHLGEKFGRHGDIKAENVLWYKAGDRVQGNNRGILVLSDLGLAALNSEKSRSMQPGNSVGATPSYRPPECDIEHGRVSRAFDIWTLGCLYLELLCWLLRGYEGKREFDHERMTTFIYGAKTDIFFDIKRLELSQGDYIVEVKDKVTEVRCTTSI